MKIFGCTFLFVLSQPQIRIMLNFILWEIRPEIWPDGSLPLRWYGLFFAAAFAFGQYIITYIFRRDGKPVKDVDALTYYMIAGTVLGARLGHCLFYQPEYYLLNPIEILKVWEGGLASHGATAGIITALWLYSRNRQGQSWLWILDRIVIVVALGGFFIRMGNLMNSEIIGKPSSLPWSLVFVQPFESALRESEGERIHEFHLKKITTSERISQDTASNLELEIVFKSGMMDQKQAEVFSKANIPYLIQRTNGDEELLRYQTALQPEIRMDEQGRTILKTRLTGITRHPAMVYEALSTFLLFVLLFLIWRAYPALPEGRLFGLFVTVLFSLRFFYEFLKENQVEFEDGLVLNMGQILSVPLVLAGIFFLFRPKGELQKKNISDE